MATFVAMEQAAAATVAAMGTTTMAAAAYRGAGATVATFSVEQTATATVAAMRATAMTTMRTTTMAASRHRTGAAATTVARTTAKVRRLGAAAQGHHQHNAVHFEILQQKKGSQPTHYQKTTGPGALLRFPWPQQKRSVNPT
jgi:hypothetical protein